MNSISLLSDAKYFDEGPGSRVSELRNLLDSKSSKDKLDAMKRLIAMVTLGRDVSALFPDVVKNVIVEDVEVKKLVYMYLIHYAEEKQDLALLTINSFQKDLTSPSQRIRANAMRAMAAIRIPVAIPLVMLALKTAVKDNSSYVRRAAACSIPKVNSSDSVDSEQRELLIELITELLTNTEPLVLGAAMYAFQEVCPDRFDLLHEHYRKICHLLADFDEWGQQVALGIMLRYGRNQFVSPFGDEEKEEKESAESEDSGERDVTGDSAAKKKKKKYSQAKDKPFYSDEETSDKEKESEESDSDAAPKKKAEKSSYELDEDHQLLLKQAGLLLYTSNSGVLMSIASLFWHLAPSVEAAKVVRPLVRMVRNKRALTFVLLANIATMAQTRPSLFRPYLKDFFINSTDPSFVRELKLDILAHIVTDLTMPTVLKEFQAYTKDPDKRFVCQTIQVLGRCAQAIPSISERAMFLLTGLVTSSTDSVAAQSVVIIRQLLQSSTPHRSIVKRMARLVDRISIPMARTAIVWMIGEYRDKIPKLAPDALRKLAKSFPTEDDQVKMQILNLAVKLFLSNPKQTSLLFKYIMDLCKYDMNYDIRDRARIFRSLFFKRKATAAADPGSEVKESLKSVLLHAKPPPMISEPFSGRSAFTLGSLSHMLSQSLPQYSPLPEFPLTAPDPSVRKPKPTPMELEAAEKAKAREERREKRIKAKKAKRGSGSESGSGSDESSSGSSDSESSAKSSDFSAFGSENSSDSSDSESGSGSDSGSGSGSDSSRSGSSKSGSSSSASSSSASEDEDEEEERRRRPKDLEASETSDSEEEKKAAALKAAREKTKRRERSDSLELDMPSPTASAEKEKSKEREREKEREPEKEKEKPKEKAKSAAAPSPADILDLSALSFSPSPASSAPAASSSSIGFGSSDSKSIEVSVPAALESGVVYPKTGASGLLLNPVNSGGLQIDYIFSRKPSVYSKVMNAIDLRFSNHSNNAFTDIQLMEENQSNRGNSIGLDEVGIGMQLNVGDSQDAKIHLAFKGRADVRMLTLFVGTQKYALKLNPTVGELVRPELLTHQQFTDKQKKLSGMQESQVTIQCNNVSKVAQAILNHFNVAALTTNDNNVHRFSSVLLHDESVLLLQCTVKNVQGNAGSVVVQVNCEDFMFAGHCIELAKKALTNI